MYYVTDFLKFAYNFGKRSVTLYYIDIAHFPSLTLSCIDPHYLLYLRLFSAWPVMANVLAANDACTFGLLK